MVSPVEGGQRAIIFNRIGGMQMDTVLAEGLHFRYYCDDLSPVLLVLVSVPASSNMI